MLCGCTKHGVPTKVPVHQVFTPDMVSDCVRDSCITQELPVQIPLSCTWGNGNTLAGTVIECEEDSGNEASFGIAAMAIEGDVAQRSPILCARHVIC